jgi:hypothetical protein
MHFVVFCEPEYINNMEQYDIHVLVPSQYIYQFY